MELGFTDDKVGAATAVAATSLAAPQVPLISVVPSLGDTAGAATVVAPPSRQGQQSPLTGDKTSEELDAASFGSAGLEDVAVLSHYDASGYAVASHFVVSPSTRAAQNPALSTVEETGARACRRHEPKVPAFSRTGSL